MTIKKIIFRTLTVIVVIVVCYVIGEVAIYSLYGKELALFPRYVTGVNYNGFKIRQNVPEARYRHKSYDGEWEFRINSQGFRSDVLYSYDKPEDTVRILVLGDSYTLGHEVDQDETYSVVLEKKLRERGLSVEVINAGVSGFSNAEELVFYEQEGMKYNPDILILGFYNNDIRDNIRAGLYRMDKENLVLNQKEYQPMINVRDFLNSFFIYRWMSEYSYLHNYLNTMATRHVKEIFRKKKVKGMVKSDPGLKRSLENRSEIIIPSDMKKASYEVKLACNIIKRIKKLATQSGARFILLDIALDIKALRPELYSSFPVQCVNEEINDYYVQSAELLKQYNGSRDDLYRPHGRRHWTDKSHHIVGEYLAKLVGDIIKKNDNN